jgi:hypothetical protein
MTKEKLNEFDGMGKNILTSRIYLAALPGSVLQHVSE